MIKDSQFDDIRPYNEEEVVEAMQRIGQCTFFALASAFVFPDRTVESVREMF